MKIKDFKERFWDKEDGVYYFIEDKGIVMFNGNLEDEICIEGMNPYIEYNTGHIDKKKRRIYVKDIVKVKNPKNPNEKLVGVVVFKSKTGKFYIRDKFYKAYKDIPLEQLESNEIEIIGIENETIGRLCVAGELKNRIYMPENEHLVNGQ
ncbi:hypothetical protein LS70_001115 [Helicobacter sp. MIT 11-5569]|uniref:hypothetical protein n=1 Tax=Helicobacter sp. MIT 11-5569 TaxID=1548151 RepID=UPI00051FCBFE|nr:hypothetical protein [Helicobacter sp. MIT 11-5569]TLD85180.1 hypothetical protein LS70_001115 [Helicobacter sp. MIT 11-5569]